MALTHKKVHLIAPQEQLRVVKASLDERHIRMRVAKKGDHAHFFIDSEGAAAADCVVDIHRVTQCVGCNLCEIRIKKTDKFALYPPLLLLPTGSAPNMDKIRDLLSRYPNCTHVAVNAPIKTGDRVRRPQIAGILGDFGTFVESKTPTREELDDAFWATSTQNDIFQTWAPMYTMFSRGNITEKKRVLDMFDRQQKIMDSTVIDLYAGIGYFTFSYAKQRPKIIYCWEINVWSVEGLLRAAKRNGFSARAVQVNEEYEPRADDGIVVFVEDNQRALSRMQQLDLRNVSHINMGLLPHARDAFPVAAALAKSSAVQTIYHVHENVKTTDLRNWEMEVGKLLGPMIYLEKIKTYSPGVLHVCGDFAST